MLNLGHYTGTTTNAFVAVFDLVNSSGLIGEFSLKNTHASASLTWRVTYTDMYGLVSVSGTRAVAAGVKDFGGFVPPTVSSGTAVGIGPAKEAKLEVEDTVGGTHATYDVYLSYVT